MATPAAKACSKCGQTKPLEEFQPNPAGKYGRKSTCRACGRAQTQEWRRRNRERTRELKREYWARHRDRLNAERRDPQERARQNAVRRARYHSNPEEYRRRQREQRESAPEKVRARQAVWYAIVTGKLERQPCEVCGDSKTQAHHDDYSKPLEVRWLCPLHHTAKHLEEVA